VSNTLKIGAYLFDNRMILFIDHVQSDPFAAPSRVRIRVPQSLAGFSPDTYRTKSR
jgi:hypothetical protein